MIRSKIASSEDVTMRTTTPLVAAVAFPARSASASARAHAAKATRRARVTARRLYHSRLSSSHLAPSIYLSLTHRVPVGATPNGASRSPCERELRHAASAEPRADERVDGRGAGPSLQRPTSDGRADEVDRPARNLESGPARPGLASEVPEQERRCSTLRAHPQLCLRPAFLDRPGALTRASSPSLWPRA